MGKIEKYGSYVCKIGYLDIRQKIVMPRIKKGLRGGTTEVKGSVDVFVYSGKHQIAGPFKSHKLGIEKAKELVENKYKFNKFKK
jgi:hypothetical protein|tara:strand:+ start:397 stop:648 length:252 start_codon:yes stop_codon:yes gene_type:complete